MNPWLNDGSSNPNNHAGFGGPMDAGMSFLQPPQTINPAQFQNPTFLNGVGRTASPAFHQPVYQTNPVIPSKRAREDSLGQSPRQAPGGLPGSRSQTPGQPFPGYTPQQNGASITSAPTPYSHLQTSSNATPSPTIQHLNHFNPAQNNQRVSTASPSPFSPQHAPPQASPAPSDQVSRGGTPHDNPQNFMPNGSFAPGFTQAQFNQPMANGIPPMAMGGQAGMPGQHPGVAMAQRNYQLQLQAQAQRVQAQAQARSMNGMSNPAQGGANPQMGPGGPAGFNSTRPNNPEDFIRGLQQFMAARGRQVDLNPVICGRPLPLLRLYAAVVKNGGSQRISKLGQWGAIASQFGFPPQQHMQAAQEMQNYWINNLAPYEAAWQMSQQKQKIAAMQGQAQAQAQMSPSREPSQEPGHQRNISMSGPNQQQAQHAGANGFSAQAQMQQEAIAARQHRSSMSGQFDPQQMAALQAQAQAHAQTPQKRPQTSTSKATAEPEVDLSKPLSHRIEDPFKAELLPPSRSHGPINTEEMFTVSQHILESKPVLPSIREMGVIDIHALTMAIKSGMHAESRLALDTLILLSMEAGLQLQLTECDDLVDTLVDCAQDQVNYLSEHATEVSDDMFLTSYEDLVRACRYENECLQDPPEYGTVAYDLERAADRLICITTLFRNFSFYEANFNILGSSEVVKLMSSVIRYLGTTEMFLRQNRNTLDFMKDGVIFFSNLSTSLQLPGKEEALSVLHFLLAFAPTPTPTSGPSDKVSFVPYSPGLHKYMPSAVDSLAKILARDEPNRTYYKTIFTSDSHSSPPYELLTRTFGLAISSIPANSNHTRAIIEARKPYLLQGMLAAEILANLAPSSDHPLARSWLESSDGFAGNLLRLVSLLSADRTTQSAPKHSSRGHPAPETDANGYGAIANRAMAVLKTLVQKARRTDDNGATIVPLGIMQSKESLLGAMIQKDIDPGILRQLCVYASLED
jgi:SWI/SNF chromatin-remodeling complex subunit SWI1